MAAEVTRAEIEQLIRKYATQFGVPLDLAMALAGSESSFNPQARGPVIPKTGRRALGLFQIYSEDVKKKYNITNPLDAEQNVRGGLNFFGDLLNDYKGNVPLALSAFNAGKGRMDDYGGGVPPFPKTIEYIRKITKEIAPPGTTGIYHPFYKTGGVPPVETLSPPPEGLQMPPQSTPTPATPTPANGGPAWTKMLQNLIAPILRIPETIRDSPALQGLQIIDPDAQEALTAAGVTERLRSSPTQGGVPLDLAISSNEAFEPSLGYRPRSERPRPQIGQGGKTQILYPDQETYDALVEGWEHPVSGETGSRSFQSFVNDYPDFPLPPGAIRIQYDGDDPTAEEMAAIFAQAYPKELTGSTNWPIGAGLAVGGLASLTGVGAGPAIGLTAAAGAGAELAAQYSRNQPIPDAAGVPRFSIVSAPMESILGILTPEKYDHLAQYQGAPQNIEDAIWASGLRGLEEAIPEGVSRGVGSFIKNTLGKWWTSAAVGGEPAVGGTRAGQSSLFVKYGPKTKIFHRIGGTEGLGEGLTAKQRRSIDPVRAVQEIPGRLGGVGMRGVAPSQRGLNHVLKVQEETRQLSDKILADAGPLNISATAVYETLEKSLGGKAGLGELIVGGKGLSKSLQEQITLLKNIVANEEWGHFKSFLPGGVTGGDAIPLTAANTIKREADEQAAKAWTKLASAGAKELPDNAAVAQKLSRAIREQMLLAMQNAGQGQLAQRWLNQNVRTMATHAAEIAIREGMKKPMLGGVAKGFAYSAPVGIGSGFVTGPETFAGLAAMAPFSFKPLQSAFGRAATSFATPVTSATLRGGRVAAQAAELGDNAPRPGGEMTPEKLATLIQELQQQALLTGGNPNQVIRNMLEGPTSNLVASRQPVGETPFAAQQRAYAEMLRRQAEEQNKAMTRPLTGGQFQGSGIFR